MDLKDVVQRTRDSATEAELAFRAGHPDDAEKYLMDQMNDIGKYFDERTTPEGDVTKIDASEMNAEEQNEKPATASPAAPAHAPGAQAAASQNKAWNPAGP